MGLYVIVDSWTLDPPDAKEGEHMTAVVVAAGEGTGGGYGPRSVGRLCRFDWSARPLPSPGDRVVVGPGYTARPVNAS
jgi:hypothetical protein